MFRSTLRATLAAALAGLALLAPAAWAAPEPADPNKHTPWHLYLTAQEAYALKMEKGGDVLFVDVREPLEIMFTGFTDMVDINIPYLLADPTAWNDKKSVFMMRPNPDFASSVLNALEARGLGLETPVILMCRSGGTRGAPSAKALAALGLETVYVVVDGFEGATSKDDPNGPWRRVNGWKNSGLPWGYKLNPGKIHIRAP